MNRLIETISKYIETRIELIKVDVQQGIAKTMVNAIQYGLIGVLGFFALIFICVGLANVFNDLTNSPFWGYFIMAGLFLAILGAVYASRKAIQVKMEKMTSNMFHQPAPATQQADATAREVIDQNGSLGQPSAFGQPSPLQQPRTY
jgi:uncharacterized membrane protein YqjE